MLREDVIIAEQENHERQENSADEAFIQWLISHGASFPKINWPSCKTESGIRGAIATSPIATEEPMVQIPITLMMTPPKAFADPDIGDKLKACRDVLYGDLVLTVYIMHELRKKSESFFYPFLRVMHEPDNLPDWSELHMRMLQDDGLMIRARNRRVYLKNLYSKTVLVLHQRFPESFPLSDFPFESFKFSWHSVQARAFGRRLPWTAMVPFADCLNHSNVQTKYDYNANQNGMFRLYPSGGNAYCLGEEVFNSYGRRGNENLLMEYGFAMLNNEWDDITIHLSLPHDNKDEDVYTYRLRNRALFLVGFHTYKSFHLNKLELPLEALMFLRIVLVDSITLEKILNYLDSLPANQKQSQSPPITGTIPSSSSSSNNCNNNNFNNNDISNNTNTSKRQQFLQAMYDHELEWEQTKQDGIATVSSSSSSSTASLPPPPLSPLSLAAVPATAVAVNNIDNIKDKTPIVDSINNSNGSRISSSNNRITNYNIDTNCNAPDNSSSNNTTNIEERDNNPSNDNNNKSNKNSDQNNNKDDDNNNSEQREADTSRNDNTKIFCAIDNQNSTSGSELLATNDNNKNSSIPIATITANSVKENHDSSLVAAVKTTGNTTTKPRDEATVKNILRNEALSWFEGVISLELEMKVISTLRGIVLSILYKHPTSISEDEAIMKLLQAKRWRTTTDDAATVAMENTADADLDVVGDLNAGHNNDHNDVPVDDDDGTGRDVLSKSDIEFFQEIEYDTELYWKMITCLNYRLTRKRILVKILVKLDQLFTYYDQLGEMLVLSSMNKRKEKKMKEEHKDHSTNNNNDNDRNSNHNKNHKNSDQNNDHNNDNGISTSGNSSSSGNNVEASDDDDANNGNNGNNSEINSKDCISLTQPSSSINKEEEQKFVELWHSCVRLEPPGILPPLHTSTSSSSSFSVPSVSPSSLYSSSSAVAATTTTAAAVASVVVIKPPIDKGEGIANTATAPPPPPPSQTNTINHIIEDSSSNSNNKKQGRRGYSKNYPLLLRAYIEDATHPTTHWPNLEKLQQQHQKDQEQLLHLSLLLNDTTIV